MKNIKHKKQNINSGFTLGLAVIIMGVLVTISLGMSTLLLRDLKLVNLTEKSSIAYNLADSGMSCANTYDSHIKYIDSNGDELRGLFPDSLSYAYDSNYRENYTGDKNFYTKDSITCFDKKILDFGVNTTLEAATALNSPPQYVGGVKTSIKIQTDYMKNNLQGACLEIEIYYASSQDKLFLSRGKVPCSGPKSIEKVIVRSVQ